jgi:histidine ammonia-lyase
MSPITRTCYEKLRSIVPAFVNDTTKYEDIKRMKNFLQEHILTENFDLL